MSRQYSMDRHPTPKKTHFHNVTSNALTKKKRRPSFLRIYLLYVTLYEKCFFFSIVFFCVPCFYTTWLKKSIIQRKRISCFYTHRTYSIPGINTTSSFSFVRFITFDSFHFDKRLASNINNDSFLFSS